MKRHKFLDMFHCPTCFDISVRRIVKTGEKQILQSNYYLVSPVQYRACKKYGFPEGLMHTNEFLAQQKEKMK